METAGILDGIWQTHYALTIYYVSTAWQKTWAHSDLNLSYVIHILLCVTMHYIGHIPIILYHTATNHLSLSHNTEMEMNIEPRHSVTWCFSDCASWIDYILITNLMHWLLFIHKILFSSTCFELQVLIFRRIQLYIQGVTGGTDQISGERSLC